MLEDRLGEREDVVDRRRIAAVEQRAGAHREHQRLAGARARAPGDQLAGLAGVRAGTGRAHEREDRFDDGRADRQPAHQALRGQEIVGAHRGLRLRLLGAGGVEQDAALRLDVGIVDVDLHQEAVELGFRKRIGAFLLERILGREHVERGGQVVPCAGHRDVMLLHRLEQRRLGARARAVDLVGHQELGEHRALDEPEVPLAAGGLFKHLGAENVGGHQVGGELDAPRVEAEHGSHGVHELRLGEAGHADEQRMAAAQHGDQRLLDHLVLAVDDGADGILRGAHMDGRAFGRANNHVLEFFQVFPGHCGHQAYSSLIPVPHHISGVPAKLTQLGCASGERTLRTTVADNGCGLGCKNQAAAGLVVPGFRTGARMSVRYSAALATLNAMIPFCRPLQNLA